MVFQFLCDMTPGAGLVVCAVCAYWRYAGLGNRCLWRVIDFTALRPEGAAEFVRRSGMLPLEVYLSDETDLEACRNAALRTTTFHMKQIKTYYGPLDKSSPFNLPWPKVEALVLCTSRPPPSYSSLQISMEDIFPQLKSLEMSRSYINQPCVLSNLRTLRITNDIPASEYVLPLLRQCPRLEVFELSAPSTPFSRVRFTTTDVEFYFERFSTLR